ncbi:uncharacterized protein IWZ02DRAFT_311348 [Phyllosticta citriasiana]|uniref:Rhodopsin domain-containing protein n=1 Tax=Phyllosticta citriasiana TaxID=595635 RepID=A0ABR1L1K5_9PEZI
MIYEDHAGNVTAMVVTLTIVGFVLFILRLVVRLKHAAWGIDDTCMVVGAFPYAVLCAVSLGGSFNGIGIHKWRFEDPDLAKYQSLGLKWFFLFEVFYCGAIIPIKLSIAWQLIRIAAGRKHYVYCQYVVMGLFTVMNVIALFFIIFHCWPVSYVWNTDPSVKGSCRPSTELADVYYATTAVNIATDWICAFLPIPLLWNVKLNRNAKVSVAGILGLGFFASLSACIRLKYTVNLNNSTDYLYSVADIVTWGYGENGLGFIVGNVSTLRPLFRKLLHLGGSDNDSKGGAMSNSYGFPQGGRRTYKEFDYELEGQPSGASSNADKFAAVATQTQIRGGGRSESVSSDSESQKKILSGNQHQSMNQGIMVSHQVNISHTEERVF